jgi:molecular chaperone GrpE
VFNPFKDRQSEDAEPQAGPDIEQADDPNEEPAPETEDGVSSGSVDVIGAPEVDADEEISLEAELSELQDRHIRLVAEFENFRKRTRKEQAESRTIAQADLVSRILPTLDDLARVADTPHESTSVEALDKGIELILRNLRKQLEDAGLSRIEAVDERFDPEVHQGILTTEVDEPDLDETVSRVFVDGYVFLDRLVRPAQVEVRRFTAEPESEE